MRGNVVHAKVGDAIRIPYLGTEEEASVTEVSLVDADGKFRRGLLSHDNGEDQLRLGLGAELAVRYLAAHNVPQEIVDTEQKIYRLTILKIFHCRLNFFQS